MARAVNGHDQSNLGYMVFRVSYGRVRWRLIEPRRAKDGKAAEGAMMDPHEALENELRGEIESLKAYCATWERKYRELQAQYATAQAVAITNLAPDIDQPTEHQLYADGFQNAIHKVAYDFVRYYVDGTDGCRNCGGFPHSETCFVWRFQSAITSDYLSRSAPVIKEMFTAGWDAGFREAQEPDRYPERDRCEDAFQEWTLAHGGNAHD